MSVDTRGACPDPELVTALVDAELDDAARDEIASHVTECSTCGPLIAAERRVKAAVVGLGDPAPSADLTARLLAIAEGEGATEAPAPVRIDKRRRMPAYFAAAASVVVLMVGAFAFIGASADQNPAPGSPSQITAIVPAADRLAQEHAVTSVQTSFGGPVAAVPVSYVQTPAPVDAR